MTNNGGPDYGAIGLLATTAYDKIGCLSISDESIFSDLSWKFPEVTRIGGTRELAFRKKIFDDVLLTDEECWPLLVFVKSILFYNLPHTATLSRITSTSSSYSVLSSLLVLASFLYENNVFVDFTSSGTFSGGAAITFEDIMFAVDAEPTISRKKQLVDSAIKWHVCSKAGLISPEFRSDLDIKELRRLSLITQKLKAKNQGTIMPVPLEDLAVLVPYCIKIVEEQSESILYAYENVYWLYMPGKQKKMAGFSWGSTIEALEARCDTGLWDVNSFKLESGSVSKDSLYSIAASIIKSPKWPIHKEFIVLSAQDFVSNRRADIPRLAEELDINIDEVAPYCRYDQRLIYHHFRRLIMDLRTACRIIILLVTGMRVSELANLTAGNVKLLPGSSKNYALTLEVFKGSEGGRGDTTTIPFPEIGAKAYKVLELLTQKARASAGTELLAVGTMVGFGKIPAYLSDSDLIAYFCRPLNLSKPPTTHQFRKSLAMFAIYHNPQNLSLIKRLFSHSSLAMTLKYIIELPGMDKELLDAIKEQNKELYQQVYKAAAAHRIGGIHSAEIIKASEDSYNAQLNFDGEPLNQYIDSTLECGERLLHRCELGIICTSRDRSVFNFTPSSCTCNAVSCENAIFTEQSVPQLINDVLYHKRYLEKEFISDAQRGFSQRFVTDGLKRLEEILGADDATMNYPELYMEVA